VNYPTHRSSVGWYRHPTYRRRYLPTTLVWLRSRCWRGVWDLHTWNDH